MKYVPVSLAVLIALLAAASHLPVSPASLIVLLLALAVYVSVSEVLIYYATFIGFFTDRWWRSHAFIWVPEGTGQTLFINGEAVLYHPPEGKFWHYRTPLLETYRIVEGPGGARVERPDGSLVLSYGRYPQSVAYWCGLLGLRSYGRIYLGSGRSLEWCGVKGAAPSLLVAKKGGVVGRMEPWKKEGGKVTGELGTRHHLLTGDEAAAWLFLLIGIETLSGFSRNQISSWNEGKSPF